MMDESYKLFNSSASMKQNKPGVPFSFIKSTINTYDIILFRGSDFVSDAIADVEQVYAGIKDFTHAGMAIRPRDLPPGSIYRSEGDQNKIYVFESTASGASIDGVPSVIDHKGHLGVQLRDLSQVVLEYDKNKHSRMAWLPLLEEFRPATNPFVVEATLTRYMGIRYDVSCVDLCAVVSPYMRYLRDCWLFRCVRNALCMCLCCAKPDTWLFCSELCAQIYIDLGIFSHSVVPADILPVDFLPAVAPFTGGKLSYVFSNFIRFYAD